MYIINYKVNFETTRVRRRSDLTFLDCNHVTAHWNVFMFSS